MSVERSGDMTGEPVQPSSSDPGGRGAAEAARFRGIRNAVLAGVFVAAVLGAIEGWQERGFVGVLVGVLAAVVAVPLVLGVLRLILRPGRRGV